MNRPPPLLPKPPRPPTRPSEQEQRVLARHRRNALRERGMQYLGGALLLSGYALLAVSPETPTEWVLLRVAFGFGLLFGGFGLAIMPWLSRVSRGEE